MRIIDELAATRCYYGRPLPTLPDILLIDIPSRFGGTGLALGRYYPVLLETFAEQVEFEAFLCAERTKPVSPALLDRRPSSLCLTDIVFAHYEPQAPGWPWLLLCCWPQSYTAMVKCPGDAFARGAYTVDAFSSPEEVDAAEILLLETLGPNEACRVQSCWRTAGHA